MARYVLLCDSTVYSARAETLAGFFFGNELTTFRISVGDVAPANLRCLRPDILISFLSPWIVPEAILELANLSINFHPAPREYPGIGCYNFALYDGAREYGAVCHHMVAQVDTGPIIEERRFPILVNDTEETLVYRTMVVMLALYHDILGKIVNGQSLEPAPVSWTKKPTTRRQLERLKLITPDMTVEETRRRIRSTTCPGCSGPYVEVGGERFYYPVPKPTSLP